MSYSRRLDNVVKQIDYVENKGNKDLINEFFKIFDIKGYRCKLSTKLYQNHVDVYRIYSNTKRFEPDSN